MNFTQAVEELDKQTDLEARQWLQKARRPDAFAALGRSVSAFRKVYLSEKACREGVPGLFRAVQAGMFHFLTYAKHWELERGRARGV